MKRLSTRLAISHIAVALIGFAVAFLLVRAMAPETFARGTGMGGPGGGGPPQDRLTAHELMKVFDDAVNNSLLLGAVAAVAVAALLSVLVVRRLLRPLEQVRKTARALAQGEYTVRVDPPHETELAALAADVNLLATALQDSEIRRTRLIGDVAHEMRTPLTVIDGSLEAMIDGVFQPDVERLAVPGQDVGSGVPG